MAPLLVLPTGRMVIGKPFKPTEMPSEAKAGPRFPRQQKSRKRQPTSRQEGIWEAGKALKYFHMRGVQGVVVNTTVITSLWVKANRFPFLVFHIHKPHLPSFGCHSVTEPQKLTQILPAFSFLKQILTLLIVPIWYTLISKAASPRQNKRSIKQGWWAGRQN